MKYEVRYVAIICVKRTIEAESLAEATVRARMECPTAVTLQERMARGAEEFRVEVVSPEPFTFIIEAWKP